MRRTVPSTEHPEVRGDRLRRQRPREGGDLGMLDGPRRKVLDLVEADQLVHALWPEAYRGGSVRCWMWWRSVNERADADVVAEAWTGALRDGSWWLRVRTP